MDFRVSLHFETDSSCSKWTNNELPRFTNDPAHIKILPWTRIQKSHIWFSKLTIWLTHFHWASFGLQLAPMTRTPWVLSPWLCQILPLAKWPWKTTCAIAMFDGKSQLPNKSKASNGALRSLLLEQYPEIIQWSNQAVNQSLSALGLTESICQSIAWIPLDLEALTSMCALHWKNSLKIPLHTPLTRSEKACHFRQACLGSHMSHPSGGFFKSRGVRQLLNWLAGQTLGEHNPRHLLGRACCPYPWPVIPLKSLRSLSQALKY